MGWGVWGGTLEEGTLGRRPWSMSRSAVGAPCRGHSRARCGGVGSGVGGAGGTTAHWPALAHPLSHPPLEPSCRGAGAEGVLPRHRLFLGTAQEPHLMVHRLVRLPLRGQW